MTIVDWLAIYSAVVTTLLVAFRIWLWWSDR